jgi:hypothetical protein
MDELVTMRSFDFEGSPVWTGTATLDFLGSPVEELERISPREIIGAYWRSVGVSWREGTRLA